MPAEIGWLCLLFFFTAAIYSAAGFGGGSTYLALLSFAFVDFASVRTLALLCNLVVVIASVVIYRRRRMLPHKVIPLTAASVPAAFIAAQFRFSETTFLILLGATLVMAALAMLVQNSRPAASPAALSPPSHPRDGLIGASVGFLAGLVGIGGGIFLAPIMHLTRWDTTKVIAATASFFILVNSVAGLLGLLISNQFRIDDSRHLWLLGAVLLGGQVGVRFCISQSATTRVRSVTALVVLAAGVRILWTQLS